MIKFGSLWKIKEVEDGCVLRKARRSEVKDILCTGSKKEHNCIYQKDRRGSLYVCRICGDMFINVPLLKSSYRLEGNKK